MIPGLGHLSSPEYPGLWHQLNVMGRSRSQEEGSEGLERGLPTCVGTHWGQTGCYLLVGGAEEKVGSSTGSSGVAGRCQRRSLVGGGARVGSFRFKGLRMCRRYVCNVLG